MQTSKTKESLIVFLSLAAVALVVDCSALYLIKVKQQFGLSLYIHLSLIMGLIIWVGYRAYYRKNRRFSILLLIMVAATGPFGASICLITAIFYSFFVSKATPPSQWLTDLLIIEDDENDLYDRLANGFDNASKKNSVEPFKDIINHGTMLQKQIAIAKITRYFHPQFAPLLLQAAQDPNAAVRVQAAAALAKIERHFTAQCIQLEKSLRDTPYYNPTWLRLAKIYEDYAHAGLLDEHSLDNLQMKAAHIYESYLAFNKDTQIQMHLARIYMRQNCPDKASALLSDTLETEEVAPPLAVLWYIESLFSMQKFAELRAAAKRYINELALLDKYQHGSEIEGALHLWRPSVKNQFQNI